MYSTAMNGFSLFTFGTSRDGAYSRQGAQGYSKGALIGRRVLIELLRYVYLNHHHHNNNITTNKCTATTTPITPTPADCDVICAFSAKRLSDKCRVLHLCKKKFSSGKPNGTGLSNRKLSEKMEYSDAEVFLFSRFYRICRKDHCAFRFLVSVRNEKEQSFHWQVF